MSLLETPAPAGAPNLDGKIFRSAETSGNGEVDGRTTFHYRQEGVVVSAEYSGGVILQGHLLGRWRPDGVLEFAYHHINEEGLVMAGRCVSEPKVQPDGRVLLEEEWQWFTGDGSTGASRILEVR